jgi:hypothetical protein
MRSFAGYLKQSAGIVISMGPFLDATDAVTPESGLASGMDGTSGILLSRNGAAMVLREVTGLASTVYDTFGHYRVTLHSNDVNTLGLLSVQYSLPATTKPRCQDYCVLPANVYDSLIPGTDLIQVDLTQINGATGPVSGIADFGVSGYTAATHKVNAVTLADTVTDLTNAPGAGDLTSTMKASVTTACTAATPVAVSVTNPVTVSGDFSATMKTSLASGVRYQIDSSPVTSPVTGSVGYLNQAFLDATISSRLGPTGVLSTVTNLTNAPTSGDLTSTMKTSITTAVDAASGMVCASVSGAVGSVTSKTGFKLAADGLDAVSAPADIANDTAGRATFVGMFRALYNRFYNKVSQSSTQQIVKNDSDTTVSTMPVTLIAGVETKGKSS